MHAGIDLIVSRFFLALSNAEHALTAFLIALQVHRPRRLTSAIRDNASKHG